MLCVLYLYVTRTKSFLWYWTNLNIIIYYIMQLLKKKNKTFIQLYTRYWWFIADVWRKKKPTITIKPRIWFEKLQNYSILPQFLLTHFNARHVLWSYNEIEHSIEIRKRFLFTIIITICILTRWRFSDSNGRLSKYNIPYYLPNP